MGPATVLLPHSPAPCGISSAAVSFLFRRSAGYGTEFVLNGITMQAFCPHVLLPAFFMVCGSSIDPAEPAVQVYRGATVLTVSHGEINDADFIVHDGKFLAVGKRGEVAVPAGARIHDVSGKVVIPGLVDTHSHIGIYPRPAVEAHQDGNEMTGAVQAGIRALDAIWPEDPGIRMALTGGVTTANIMPGSGNVIGGQTLYVKLRPGPITHMMVQPGKPEGGLKMANGENPKRAYGAKNQPPGTRMRLAAMQREQFVKAIDYRRKWEAYRKTLDKAKADLPANEKDHKSDTQAKEPTEPERDLALESLVEVLDRKRTVHFHSHRSDDIMTVARLAEEFGFEVVLQHGTEAYKVAEELARRKIPVSLTIPDSPGGKPEVDDLIEQNAAILEKAGVKLAINTDDFITESRFLLRTASLAMRGGSRKRARAQGTDPQPGRDAASGEAHRLDRARQGRRLRGPLRPSVQCLLAGLADVHRGPAARTIAATPPKAITPWAASRFPLTSRGLNPPRRWCLQPGFKHPAPARHSPRATPAVLPSVPGCCTP